MSKEDFEKWHKKIGEKHKGKVITKEQREKISKTLNEYFKNEESRNKISKKNKGRKLSLLTRLRMSMAKQAMSKEINMQFAKKVLQYDLDDNFLAEYESAKAAADKIGKRSGNICECCNGNRKTAYGFKWKYDEEYNKKYRKTRKNVKS